MDGDTHSLPNEWLNENKKRKKREGERARERETEISNTGKGRTNKEIKKINKKKKVQVKWSEAVASGSDHPQ